MLLLPALLDEQAFCSQDTTYSTKKPSFRALTIPVNQGVDVSLAVLNLVIVIIFSFEAPT